MFSHDVKRLISNLLRVFGAFGWTAVDAASSAGHAVKLGVFGVRHSAGKWRAGVELRDLFELTV